MTPLPKRKHSTRRKGKRLNHSSASLPTLVKCKNCGKNKVAHRICKYCNK